MNYTGNTILITGGGSGIGRALAEASHAAGNQIIIAGRRQAVLDETVAANPGMRSVVLDIADAEDIRTVAARLTADFPALNVVIHNAGIMQTEEIQSGNLDSAEATVATNLLGPIRLTAALLPHLLAQPTAAIMTVSSGLAFVPMALTPTYSATKAAIHSYTESLRHQLRGTAVEVFELVPPYVQTELMGAHQANDPHAMPLQEFIDETMSLLGQLPNGGEVLVERVKPLRLAEATGKYEFMYGQINRE
ncbi:SDR family oxidoreductase [Deinococcus puniceus]|uniref:DltE n=1 Tax=Deinococcus puniceus TaxID=1182568 RepID=A0A172TBW8_9DEIO|nr:SDR family oxidoreductase [Deinococcus puniceus]ANE44481.1 DltE [Deinococcus puniceus]